MIDSTGTCQCESCRYRRELNELADSAAAVRAVAERDEQIAALTADNAALRKVIERFTVYLPSIARHPNEAKVYIFPFDAHCPTVGDFRYALASLQSPNPGADLLKRHAEELTGAKLQLALHDTQYEAEAEALRQRVEAAEQYSAELNSRQVALLQERDAANSAWAKCEQEAAALTKERDEARDALDNYGEHDPDCNLLQNFDNKCTCGFDDIHNAILIASGKHRTIDATGSKRTTVQSEQPK